MPTVVTSAEDLIARLAGRRERGVLAVSGFGGAGKSTLARAIAAGYRGGGAAVVPADEFWVPARDGRSSSWEAYDWARLTEQVLRPARDGRFPLRYQPLDPRDAPDGSWREVSAAAAAALLVVEGVGLLQPALLPWFDATVWIDCPLEVAAARGGARDRDEYGLDTAADWRERWVPNDRDFFDRFRPDLAADYVLANGREPCENGTVYKNGPHPGPTHGHENEGT